MIDVCLAQPVERLLVIGSHPDDIEIGCGGTILSLVSASPGIRVTWVVLAAEASREYEAHESATSFLAGAAAADIEVHGFTDGFLPAEYTAVKRLFDGLKRVEPNLVLTHTRADAHQDHRLACELTWNTFRDHLILEYEIPKWDGDLGRPNAYVALGSETVDRKIELLERHFPSQSKKHWFDAETFRGLMRVRGVECGAQYAEAFSSRKWLLDVETGA